MNRLALVPIIIVFTGRFLLQNLDRVLIDLRVISLLLLFIQHNFSKLFVANLLMIYLVLDELLMRSSRLLDRLYESLILCELFLLSALLFGLLFCLLALFSV